MMLIDAGTRENGPELGAGANAEMVRVTTGIITPLAGVEGKMELGYHRVLAQDLAESEWKEGVMLLGIGRPFVNMGRR